MTTTFVLSDLTGDYTLDLARTRIGFVARHTIGPEVRGRFDDFEGHARLDGGDPARSAVQLTVQSASIQSGNPKRDEYLRDKYLNLAEHPAITFTSSEVRQIGATAFELTGDLTIRGVRNPITVNLELTSAEHDPSGDLRLQLKGGATINRKDWGVHWSAAAGLVAGKVTLEFDVAALRRP
ncbi:YceI family protein [Nonomuraea sp. NPDC049607]|uniref:YceI family protein n=1 Tax=Nonomuraea sp. NPDC049607 TaxID=3154732 RepID=UPI0034293F2C